jgi:hypothetical protein
MADIELFQDELELYEDRGHKYRRRACGRI